MAWLGRGGLLMWPILACALVAFGLLIERAIVFLRNLRSEESLRQAVVEAVERNDLAEAARLCREAQGLRLRLIAHFLEDEILQPGKTDLATLQRAMEEKLQNRALPLLTARLSLLATIGRVTPLLGLLGTVQGMILMFAAVGESGTGLSSDMSRGIGNALITTFAGLCVAIPVQFAEGILESRVDKFIPQAQSDLFWFLSKLREIRFRQHVIRIRPEEVK